jgi:hypothetical protein
MPVTRGVEAHLPETCDKWTLESWEQDVLVRHKLTSGTILVLGAGVGRESIALAQRGFIVVGIDINRESLCVASQRAMAKGLQPLFVQADFLAIPIAPARVDYLFMSGIMYSSIPGRKQRQTWLRSLRTCMSQHGLVVLNFMIDRERETRTRQLSHRLNRWLTKLPGTNQSYQLVKQYVDSLGTVQFKLGEELRPELDGGVGPFQFALSEQNLAELNQQDADLQRDACQRDSLEPSPCRSGMHRFHIDAYGQLQLCYGNRQQSYDLRTGSFQTGFFEALATFACDWKAPEEPALIQLATHHA